MALPVLNHALSEQCALLDHALAATDQPSLPHAHTSDAALLQHILARARHLPHVSRGLAHTADLARRAGFELRTGRRAAAINTWYEGLRDVARAVRRAQLSRAALRAWRAPYANGERISDLPSTHPAYRSAYQRLRRLRLWPVRSDTAARIDAELHQAIVTAPAPTTRAYLKDMLERARRYDPDLRIDGTGLDTLQDDQCEWLAIQLRLLYSRARRWRHAQEAAEIALLEASGGMAEQARLISLRRRQALDISRDAIHTAIAQWRMMS